MGAVEGQRKGTHVRACGTVSRLIYYSTDVAILRLSLCFSVVLEGILPCYSFVAFLVEAAGSVTSTAIAFVDGNAEFIMSL